MTVGPEGNMIQSETPKEPPRALSAYNVFMKRGSTGEDRATAASSRGIQNGGGEVAGVADEPTE